MNQLQFGQALQTAEKELAFTQYKLTLKIADLEQATVYRYTECLNTYSKWLDVRLPTLETAKEFLAYLRQQGYAPASVALYYHALRPFHESLGQILKLRLRKNRTLPPYHPPKEIARMLAKSEDNKLHHMILLTLAYTGLRRGELLALQLKDLSFPDRIIRVEKGKGRRTRVIGMHPCLVEPLNKWCRGKGPRDRVFSISPAHCSKIVRKYATMIGSDIHTHSLRHYCCTQLLERGNSIRAVQEHMGHTEIGTTAIYWDIVPSNVCQIVDSLEPLTNELIESEED